MIKHRIKMKNKKAFTLAEVLITIAIVGIVAAMTLPTIIENHKEKVTVTKVKTVYSILDQGFQQMITDNGTVDTWGDDEASRGKKLEELVPKYFQVIKSWKKGGSRNIGQSYDNRFRKDFKSTFWQGIIFILKDGTILYFENLGSLCYQTKDLKTPYPGFGYQHGSYLGCCANVYVDINGAKAPNMMDEDLFRFVLETDGVIPAGSYKESVWTETFNNQCLGKNVDGTGNATCTAWVIYNGNMDYLHCDNLSWNGKTKCK